MNTHKFPLNISAGIISSCDAASIVCINEDSTWVIKLVKKDLVMIKYVYNHMSMS